MTNKLGIKSEFVKHVFTLLSGTVIAQSITLLLSPVLTRLFTPEQFGVFFLFTNLVNPLAILASGRYELAIILPENDKKAFHTGIAAIFISALFSVGLFIIISAFNQPICNLIGSPEFSFWLYFVPPAVFLVTFSQTIFYWLMRFKLYTAVSINKVAQTLGGGAVQWILGLSKTGTGLLMGDFTGKILTVIFGLFQVSKNKKMTDLAISKSCVSEALSAHRDFPRFNAVPAFLDSFASNMPTFIVNSFYDLATNSFFNFSRQIIGNPLFVISGAVSQVMYKKMADYKNNNEPVLKHIIKTITVLSLFAVLYCILVFFLSEEAFAFVFGEKWRVAGYYAKFLGFSFAVRFVVSPLSIVFPAFDRIKWGGLWQICYFCSISILYFLKGFSIEMFLIIYVVIDVIVYLLYLYMILRVVKGHDQNIGINAY